METPCVASLSEVDASGNPIRFTISTDIVDYAESARRFGEGELVDPSAHGRFQRRVIALPDRRGPVLSPMLLTLATDGGLYLVRRNHGPGAEWASTDLGAAFARAASTDSGSVAGSDVANTGEAPHVRAHVRAVGASATADDRITIAVAVDDGPGKGSDAGSRVFVAYDLNSATTDWSNVPWEDCGFRQRPVAGASRDEPVYVDAIRVVDNGNRTWTLAFAGSDGPRETVYLLRSDLPAARRAFANSIEFTPATDIEEVLDFEAGVHPNRRLGSGLYVLGKTNDGRSLWFRPFPAIDLRTGKAKRPPPVVLLPVRCADREFEPNVLETGPTTDSGTDLYVGGQGIYLIAGPAQDDGEEAEVVELASPGVAPDVVDLAVGAEPGRSACVWSRHLDGSLNVISQRDGGAWGTPLRLRSSVQQLAPVGGDEHQSGSVMLVYGNGTAAHVWRDQGSGAWREVPIHVADPEEVSVVTAYGTSVRLLDDAGIPRPGVCVRVTASVLSSVVIDGNAAHLGPAVAYDTVTDSNGAVSVFDRVRSLTPAIYRLAFDTHEPDPAAVRDSAPHEFDVTLDVNPAAGVQGRLQKVTGDELRAATATALDGTRTPLLGRNLGTGRVDAVAHALSQGAMLAATTDGQIPGVRSTRPEAAGLPFTQGLRSEAIPAGYRWGIQSDGRSVVLLRGSELDALAAAAADAGEFFAGLGDSLADFFEGLWHRVKEGFSFVLHKTEEAFEFVCNLAGKVRRWVLKTLEEVGAFFTWLWDQIEVGLENVWQWLKFVFDWQDILRVRNAMVRATEQELTYLGEAIGRLKGQVVKGFDDVGEQIEKWRLDAGGAPVRTTPAAAPSTAAEWMKYASVGVEAVLDQAMGNSVVAWVIKRLETVTDELIEIKGPLPTEAMYDATDGLGTGLARDEIDDVIGCARRLGSDAADFFDGKLPYPQHVGFETLRDALIIAGSDALEGLLAGARDLALRALDAMVDLINAIHDALFVEIRFPFVEKLLRLVGADVDTSSRLIDGVMLLAAVPATVAYKIMVGRSPAEKDEDYELPFGRATVQSDDFVPSYPAYYEVDPDEVGNVYWDLPKAMYSFLRRYAILTLCGAMVKFGLAFKKVLAGVSTPSLPIQFLFNAFQTLGLAADVGRLHGLKGDNVKDVEIAMTCVGAAAVTLRWSTWSIQVKRGAPDDDLFKLGAGVEAACAIVIAILSGVDYALSRDGLEAMAAETGDETTTALSLEALKLSESLGDRVGTALGDAALFTNNADVVLAAVGAAAICKAVALACATGTTQLLAVEAVA